MENRIHNEMELFQKVERGELTAEEASKILEKMQDGTYGEGEHPGVQPADQVEQIEDMDLHPDHADHDVDVKRFGKFTRWWVIPYTIGVIVTTLGAFWIYLGWNGGEITFGFWLAWIPFLTGVLLMALSWRARASHWLHIRLKQGPGRHPERVSFSFPLPFGLIKWANRNFGHHFPPEVRGIDLDELIDEMEMSVTYDNPIYIWVDDQKEQNQFEVWIGRGASPEI